MIRAVRAAWAARWNALRLAIAATLLAVLVTDGAARSLRRDLARLPGYDAAAEVARLRHEGRFGEALVIADAALPGAPPADASRIARERDLTAAEQSGWVRRLRDAAVGAATGGYGRDGMSLEMVLGAVAADMLVVGDVRDLAIQGWRYATEGEADPVIVALSAIGLATTLAPEVDWAPAVLKVARRVGAMGDALASTLTRAARAGDRAALASIVGDTAALSRAASPGGAVRLLRHAGTAEDLARLARFAARTGPRGAAALHVTGEAGATLAKSAQALVDAGRAADAARLEGLLFRAATRGERGGAWLARSARVVARPHWIAGALKGVYKGHATLLAQHALERLDPAAAWLIGPLAAWVVLECGLMLRRAVRPGPGRLRGPPGPAPAA